MENYRLKLKNSKSILTFCTVILIFAFYIFMLPSEARAATISRPMHSLGLVGYWSFDVGKGGTTAYDLSGSGNKGTLTNMDNAGAWVGGKIGNALEFDGSDDYVSVNAFNLSTTNAVALSFWMYKDNFTTPEAVTFELSTNQNLVTDGFLVDANSGAPCAGYFQINVRGNATPDGNNTGCYTRPSAGAWHHYVAIFDKGKSSNESDLYIDGVLQTAVSRPNNADNTNNFGSEPLYMMSRAGTSVFDIGKIDEVRIYNRALSAEEIKLLYRMQKPQFNASQADKLKDGLVGMWTFDGNDMGTPSARDRAGNGNTGWLVNGGISRVIGKIGQSIDLAAAPGCVDMGNPAVLSNLGPVTFGAWIYPRVTDGGDFTILGKRWQGSFSEGTHFHISAAFFSDDGMLEFRKTGSTQLVKESTQFAVRPNQWQYVVFTYDGGTSASNVHFYVNGTETSYSTSQNGASFSSDASRRFTIGGELGDAGSANCGQFNGLIDEVRVYNRILTPAEIQRLYKMGQSLHANITRKTTLTDGLVGHWSFDGNDMGTTSARDSSGSGNTGWLLNGVQKVAGKIGQGLRFNYVSNSYINLGSPTPLDNVLPASYSVWFNPASYGNGNNNSLVEKLGGTNNVQLYTDKGVGLRINFVSGFSSDICAVSGDNLGEFNAWYHIVATIDANRCEIWKNGVWMNTDSVISGTHDDSAGSMTIGGVVGASRALDGVMDEVRIYNRVLNPDEIKRLYNMGR